MNTFQNVLVSATTGRYYCIRIIGEVASRTRPHKTLEITEAERFTIDQPKVCLCPFITAFQRSIKLTLYRTGVEVEVF